MHAESTEEAAFESVGRLDMCMGSCVCQYLVPLTFFLGAAPHPHPQEYMAIAVHHGGHRWITDGGSNVLDNTGGEGGSGLQRIHHHVSAEAGTLWIIPLLWCTTAAPLVYGWRLKCIK